MAINDRQKWVKCDRYGRGADLCVTNTTTVTDKRNNTATVPDKRKAGITIDVTIYHETTISVNH